MSQIIISINTSAYNAAYFTRSLTNTLPVQCKVVCHWHDKSELRHNELDAAHYRWQRSILGISWKDKVTNAEVRTRTGQQSIIAWTTYSEKEDCAGWVTFCGWTTDGYHNRHYTGRFQVSRKDLVDQELTG